MREERVLFRIKRQFEQYKLYLIARELKWCLQNRIKHSEVVSLSSKGSSRGYVLLSYMNEAFLQGLNHPMLNTHLHYWQSIEMANAFTELGYSVDVIHYHDQKFLPQKQYSVVVDVRHNMERLAALLDKECIKIMHLDTAHILFHNAAEARRLLMLQQRRGVTLRPVRFEMPNLGIEYADCATTCGNEFTVGTFRYANKPIYRLPIPSQITCPWPANKDFGDSRKQFLWFASGGLVHKGLDLVLEAFVGMPDLQLTVCGPITEEPSFVSAYYKELYRTANIRTVGWLDIHSAQFMDLMRRCIGHVFTSCSEGGGACVIETMHAGLIPIVSYESSVDVWDFGIMLKSASIEDIQAAVRTIADMPVSELESRSRQAWAFARENHTREKFGQAFRKTLNTILATSGW